jgi:hypothetical protein
MRICAGLSRVDFALLSRLGATSGATNTQGLFLFSFHNFIMQDCPAINWSIVTVLLSRRRCRNSMLNAAP